MTLLKTTTRKKGEKKEDCIPSILYGEGTENLILNVKEKDFQKAYQEVGESALVSLEVGDKKFEVLIHQIQYDPLTDEVIHIDFFRPSSKKKVETDVPLTFIGEAPAVNNLGGILVRELYHIKVKALVKDLPREIEINLNSLETFDDKIIIKDLDVKEGVEVLHLPEDIIAHIQMPKEEVIEEEVKEEETEETEEATEPKQPTEETE